MAINKTYELKAVFGKNLKFYRLENNLTQSELAEKANLSEKFISDLERGIFGASLDTIIELSKILNIEPYFLLKNDESHNGVPSRLDIKTGTRKRKAKC